MTTNKHINQKHLAHAAVVKQQQKMIMTGGVVVIVAVVLLVLYGVLSNTVLLPFRNVATVNGDKISAGEFQKYVKIQRINSINTYTQYYQYAQMFGIQNPEEDQSFGGILLEQKTRLSSTDIMGQSVLDTLVEDRLVRQEAERRGITVDKAELDKYLQDSFGYFPDGTPTTAPTATMYSTNEPDPESFAIVTITPSPTIAPTESIEGTTTPEQVEATATAAGPTATQAPTSTPAPTATAITAEGYKDLYNERVTGFGEQTGITEDEFVNLYESYILREKLLKEITKDLVPFDEQVWARHILVKTKEEAQAVIDRLNAGEDWVAISKEVSIDTGSKDNGGDLGWFGKGMMVKPFEEAAYALTVGQISAPVESEFGFHIIQLIGKQEKPITETEFATKKQTYFAEFLAKLKEEATIEIDEFWKTIVPTEPAAPF